MDWPPLEYLATVNHDGLGNRGLGGADETARVDFMKTLGDSYNAMGRAPRSR